MSKKVVMLGPYPPPHGGVSIYVAALFDRLKSRGLNLWTYGEEELSGARVRFMHDKRREIVPLLLREGRGARLADCTHFLLEYPSALVPVWVILKRLLGFEWVKIVQDGTLPARHARFSRSRRALFRLAARNATEFIVLSEELRRWLRDDVGVRQNVSLIKNLFPAPNTEGTLPTLIEETLEGFMRRAKRIASVGVFIEEYGFLHTAEAVERLRRETGEDFGLLLLDGGFASDAVYREETLRGREWITVLRSVEHADVFRILRRCDAFVRGTLAEGYGLSRVEAIWCGLPVVATRVGETRGMLLYDFGDTGALASQLQRALSGEHARETEEWAERYRREAEENLHAITSKLFED